MEKIKKKCVKCGSEAFVVLHKTYSNFRGHGLKPNTAFQYVDEYGKKWNGNICRECVMADQRKRNGRVPWHKSKNKKIASAAAAENKAKKIFESLGFSVVMGHGRGPDLFCELGTFRWTVEVKLAGYASGSWRTGAILGERRNDDLVAMVLPNGRVYIDSMKHHLAAAGKYGNRTITGIVREFGGIEFKDKRLRANRSKNYKDGSVHA